MDRIDRAGRPAVAARPSPWRLWLPVASAAAAAAAVTFAVLHVQSDARQRQSTRYEQSQAARFQSLVDRARAERDLTIDQLRRRLAEQQQVVDALEKPTTAVVTLAGTASQPGAAARLLWDAAGHRSVLLAAQLPALPAGRTYELWFIPADQKPRRAATFAVGPTGAATVATPIPADLGPLTLAAVSDEPAGGTDSPTGTIRLAGKP